MTVKLLPTQRRACSEQVEQILHSALEEGFEDAVVVGIRSNGTFTTYASATLSRLRRLGALTLAVSEAVGECDEAG